MNFKIYHNGTEINEADNYDNLMSAIKAYSALNYSNITVYHPEEDGIKIDNQPEEGCGIQTGFFEFDHYGCWYEYKLNSGKGNRWMIGDYPYNY